MKPANITKSKGEAQPGGGKRKNRSKRKEARQLRARARQLEHDSRSLTEKAQRASRFGECKEFVRLHAALSSEVES